MASFCYRIRSTQKNKLVKIQILFTVGRGNQFYVDSQYMVLTDAWDNKRQTVKSRFTFTDDFTEQQGRELTKNLSELRSHILGEIAKDPEHAMTKTRLEKIIYSFHHPRSLTTGRRVRSRESLGDYIARFTREMEEGTRLNIHKLRYGPSTIKNYKGFVVQFDEYCKARRKQFDFADIDLKFYDDFVAWFTAKNYSVNTIGRHVKELKIIMRAAREEGLHDNGAIESRKFRVLTADNGADGLTLIHDEMPDVVITDVLMSQMDGYELCHRIKHDLALSHIPVVILTAKISDQDKITGYQEGADVYMTKPFSPELLQTVVDNLLTSRKRLRDMLLSQARRPQEAEPENGEIHLSAADRTFMDKLCGIIDENISDNSLSTDTVCTAMCMSRASLFRKIKSLTGVSLNRFILIYRLNRAAEMVRSREYRFNEIADMLGFSTQSHFSYCFKQQFGMSPREYASRS